MAQPNTKLPTDDTVKRDFDAGTVQPGPGMAPDKPPAEDEQRPGSTEELRKPGASEQKKDQSARQAPSGGNGGNCGCG
jgi:hypothetical protein